jgi:hypothetical protein
MLGKVTVWQMTEEERLAYIAKHPIKPSELPKGVKFDTDTINHKLGAERRKEALKGKTIMDAVDKDLLHKLFISGKRLAIIAETLNISEANLHAYIAKQRKIDPEKWPNRVKGVKGKCQ